MEIPDDTKYAHVGHDSSAPSLTSRTIDFRASAPLVRCTLQPLYRPLLGQTDVPPHCSPLSAGLGSEGGPAICRVPGRGRLQCATQMCWGRTLWSC